MASEVARDRTQGSDRRRSAILNRRVSSLHGAGPETCVVFHMDQETLRAGISGEYSLRCAIPIGSRSTARQTIHTPILEEPITVLDDERLGVLEDCLEEAVRTAINRYLYFPLKAKLVVLVEDHYLPMKLKRIMARVLFTYHQPREVTFMHAGVCAALALGITSGIILDIGLEETTVVPIYGRRPINALTRSTRFGRMAIKSRTRYLLSHFCNPVLDRITDVDVDNFVDTALICLPTSPLPPDTSDLIADDDLEKCYNIAEYHNKTFTWTVPSSKSLVHIPQWTRFAIVELFFEARNEYADSAYNSLSRLILSSIANASIDIRADLKTIAVTGSLCDIPGLQTRIRRETGTFLLDNTFGPDLAWTGGSLAASLGFGGPSVTIQQFNSTSRVPDWTVQARR